MVTFVKDAEGFYLAESGDGPFKTKLCPIDSSTYETWADTLIRKGFDAIEHGFGLCSDGRTYILRDFLADTYCSDVPWSNEGYKELHRAFLKHPEFKKVCENFKEKYKVDYFSVEESTRIVNGEDDV